MVHQGISVENALTHLDDVQVMVSQGHSVPEKSSVARLRGLSVSILADHVLHCVKLRPTVVGVHNDLSSTDLALLFSIHQRFLLHLLLSGSLVLLSFSPRADYLILVRGWLLLLLTRVTLLLLQSYAVIVQDNLLFRGSVVRRLYLCLASSLVLNLLIGSYAAWRRVSHSHHFSVVMLNLYFLKSFVRNLTCG